MNDPLTLPPGFILFIYKKFSYIMYVYGINITTFKVFSFKERNIMLFFCNRNRQSRFIVKKQQIEKNLKPAHLNHITTLLLCYDVIVSFVFLIATIIFINICV